MNQSELSTIASRARRIVEVLATKYPSRHGRFPHVLNAAGDFIEQEFCSLGYVVESQSYECEGAKVRNLIAEKQGSRPDQSCIIVGAHYDTVVGTPGADDNASGVAGLLELARLLKDQSVQRTVKFVAFPHEEPPYFYTHLMGSRQYAQGLKQQGENVLVMLALEMLGYAGENYRQIYPAPLMRLLGRYPKYGNYIALVGNLKSLGMMSVVRKAMRDHRAIGVESLTAPGFIPPLFLSDHSSFWKAGFPALMVTDTAFLRNPHYHKESDTPDRLNYEFLASVVSSVYIAVQSLDNQP
ncbi:MAG: M20/M25/M40 family metallo-hydrolase [Ignavibacteriales bacterium]|nr:M20/M25/M40 family metallo-hydrolase [Ignavibacteriales bacterium]